MLRQREAKCKGETCKTCRWQHKGNGSARGRCNSCSGNCEIPACKGCLWEGVNYV